MKILAIEKEIEGADWESCGELLRCEALHVFKLYLSDILREIYFTDDELAVLVLECTDKASAKETLDALPLVVSGKISFDIMELRPYTGYERLIKG
jgi:hypothetical protein